MQIKQLQLMLTNISNDKSLKKIRQLYIVYKFA
nr:MAG TPA: hypothetical protein [Caudoviricetes sp.]